MAFHAKDGLHFEKLDNGSVRVFKHADARPDSPIVADVTLDRDCWASMIAQMSFYGEEDYGFYRAGYFHFGTPYHRTDEWAMDEHIAKRERRLLFPDSTEAFVNGKRHTLPREVCYEMVVQAAGFPSDRVLSVTYRKAQDGRQGILSPGRVVEITNQTQFDVADTSNA